MISESTTSYFICLVVVYDKLTSDGSILQVDELAIQTIHELKAINLNCAHCHYCPLPLLHPLSLPAPLGCQGLLPLQDEHETLSSSYGLMPSPCSAWLNQQGASRVCFPVQRHFEVWKSQPAHTPVVLTASSLMMRRTNHPGCLCHHCPTDLQCHLR